MEKLFANNAMKIWSVLKPWLIIAAVMVFLRYTGLLSGISILTGSALMQTGVLDAKINKPAVARRFNYDFKIRDVHGAIINVDSFKNKIIFLNIWATWCGPCRMEMPSIQSLYNRMDTAKVAFIMLSVDSQQDFEKVQRYISDKGFTFPVYVPAGALPNLLQVKSIPTTFVIAPDGKVVSSESGATNYDTPEFKQFLESLLLP
ncbi:MAG: TlpA disulfide reductase family protein [Chryseolinea sp.]